MYGSTKDADVISDSRKLLDWIYGKIPETKGCMENLAKGQEGCKAWCCETQQPQVLYVEFLNSWNTVKKSWKDDEFIALVERSLRAYLFEENRKTCVFWNKETHLCTQHETRPFSCRMYGIIPEEEFRPRYERLKVIYPDTRYQCGLVSTANGSTVTKADSDAWWKLVKGAERSIGIKEAKIHDDFGGSYRTYYEHILVESMGEEGMMMLSAMRAHGSAEEKEATITRVVTSLRSFIDGKTKSPDKDSGVS